MGLLQPVRALLFLAAFLLADPAAADSHRSSKAVRQFRAQQPCPASGKTAGPCRGYVVDHVKPLCAGGADRPSNLQWQTIAEAKKKDPLGAAECRALRRKR
jgi:hypothetical protein